MIATNHHRLPLLPALLLSLLLAACSSTEAVPVEQANPAAYPEARAVIPIAYYESGSIPVFQVQDTENGRTLNLGFDSGYAYNAMYSSMVDEEFKVESQSLTKEHVRSQYPDLSRKKVEKRAEQWIEAGYIRANVSGLQAAGMEFAAQQFTYEPTTPFKNQTIDGMVGLEFFGECRTLTVDYVNHLIVLDAPPLQGEALPMTRSPFHTLYTIPITIDGVAQSAIIDSGASHFIKANKKAATMSEEEKWEFVLSDTKILKWTMGWKTVEVTYGSTTDRVKAIAATNMFSQSSDMTTRSAYVYNLFGWPFMKSRAVQFDFEGGRFILGQQAEGGGE